MGIDYDKCPDCNEFWVTCPCCDETFCPDCGLRENDASYGDDEDETD